MKNNRRSKGEMMKNNRRSKGGNDEDNTRSKVIFQLMSCSIEVIQISLKSCSAVCISMLFLSN